MVGCSKSKIRHKTFRFYLKLSIVLFLLIPTQLFAQINISQKNTTVGKVINEIKQQSGYNFFYQDRVAQVEVPNVDISNKSLREALDILLEDKNISYRVEDGIVHLTMNETQVIKQQADQKRDIPVSGTVLDENGEELIGVRITIKGSSTGTITDAFGRFSLNVDSPEAVLQFSYVGYKLNETKVGSNRTLQIVMEENIESFQEIVVTALGIKRDKKLLGYSMQEISGEAMNQTGNPNVLGALQGKISGMQLNVSPTGLNGSTKITIRGNSSLTDNNQPLWIVDGIPFGDESNSSVSVYGGIDRGGTSVDINPEDIETISILKGPNAAALYGSRAGNGVILITTKKGAANKGLGVTYNTTVTWTQVAETLNMQTKYGQGQNGQYNKTVFSYGDELDDRKLPAWWKNAGSDQTSYSYNGNKLKDYFNNGISQNHNISIGNVTEDSHYRTSFGYLGSKGLFEGETLERFNIDLNSGKDISKYISMDSKLSLSKTTANNRPYVGLYGEMYQLLYMPNNINLDELREHSSWTATHAESGNKYQLHDNWLGPDMDYRNPYWMRNQRTNMDERWRVFGYHSIKLKFTDWLYATGKFSIDYYRTKIEETDKGLGLSIENLILNDSFDKSEFNNYEMNSEFMVHGNNQLNRKIRIDYGLGGNMMYTKGEGLYASAQNMNQKGVWYLNSAGQQVYAGNGIPTFANQTLLQKKVNSVFGTFQLAYDDYLSLDLTGRNDWSSTLPAPHSYFYPSLNLSFIGTEFINKMDGVVPAWLTFGKYRVSIAKAGKDTQPYSLYTYNTYRQGFNGPSYNRTKTYVSPDLKPEMNTSFETGLEMKFLRNRLGFDLTYYNSVTNNQIMLIPSTSSSTFDNWRINAGSIQNRGIEFALYTTPVEKRNFEFSLDFNFAHNNTIVKKLHDDKKFVDFGVDNFFVTVGAVEGGRLGDIYAARIFKRDDNGNLIINKYTGLPQAEERRNFDEKYVLGNIQPDLMMSVAPSFTFFKNIHLSAFIDMKFGGNIVSVTEAIATHYGTAARTLDRNEDFVIPGVYSDGTPNDKPVSKELYYRYIGDTGKNNGLPENFVYDASFIKFRELAFAYSLNRKVLNKTPFNTVRLSLVGRDLFYIFKNTPGTNPEGGFDTSMYSQALDYLSTPNTRTIGFSVNASF